MEIPETRHARCGEIMNAYQEIVRLRLPASIRFLLLGFALAAGAIPAAAAAAERSQGPAYLDSRHPFAERAVDLVSRMTLDEKAAQLTTTNAPAIPRLGVQSYSYWNESQHGVYFLQGDDNATGEPRWFHRVAAPSFPTNLSTSLTWDPRLIRREAAAISDEVRGFNDPSLFGQGENNLGDSAENYGSLFHFNPTVNLQRDPRWGRTDEAFGEDPFLVSKLAGAYVSGFEGRSRRGAHRDRYLKAVATLKHYALNNVERNRTGISSDTDESAIRDYYTAQFRGLIEDSGASGLMSSYNAVNGTPAVADSFLLNVLARRTWGLDGYVTSDCGAVATTYRRPDQPIGPGGVLTLTGHDWAPPGWTTDHGGVDAQWTERRTGAGVSGQAGGQAYSLRAGTDLNCAGAGTDSSVIRSWFGEDNAPARIREAIDAGVLSEGTIDRALARVFKLRLRTGEFDPRGRVPFASIGSEVIDSAAHRRLTETVARRALVLLKNERNAGDERVLPFDPAKADRVVVLGDLADRVVLGGYSGTPTERVSAREGIADLVEKSNPGAEVLFDAAGTSTAASGPAVLSAPTEAAIVDADLVVIVVGTDEGTNQEGADRATIAMPGNYRSLVEQVAALGNPNVVLHVQAAGPVSLAGIEDEVPAMLYSGPNGQRQGSALAKVLFGEANPSGRLSFTWFRGDSQLPPIDDYDLTPARTGGLGRTYRYFTGRPSYPFGHGRSYSRFRYSQARIGRGRVFANGSVPVSVKVRNTGDLTGATVVEIYAATRGAAGGRALPAKRLVAFARTDRLAPSASQRLRWRVPVERLRLFDSRRGRDVVYRRRYRFQVARSATDVIDQRSVRVRGSLRRPIRQVTVEPERLVLKPGERLSLRGRNRWLEDTTTGIYSETGDRVVEAVRGDDSFANLRRADVSYSSNHTRVARVTRRGVIKGRSPGTATITVTVNGVKGHTAIAVR